MRFIAVPLMTASEFLALTDAKPPRLAVPALRLRTTPADAAVVPLPTGNLAGVVRWIPVWLIINPPLAAVPA